MQFIDRLIDYIDSDQLPEPFGVEDLFYIADENLNLTADTLIVHKTQIQDLKFLMKMNLGASVHWFVLYQQSKINLILIH